MLCGIHYFITKLKTKINVIILSRFNQPTGYGYYRTISFAPELLNAVADPVVPCSGSHKQNTTTFGQEYALENAPFEALDCLFSGEHAPDSSRANNRLAVPTVVCENYCKKSAPQRLSIPRSATEMIQYVTI